MAEKRGKNPDENQGLCGQCLEEKVEGKTFYRPLLTYKAQVSLSFQSKKINKTKIQVNSLNCKVYRKCMLA